MNTLFISTLILSGGQVFLGLAAIAGSIYCGVLSFKSYLNHKSEQLKNEIVGEHSSDDTSPLTRKYESVNLHKHGKSIQLVGTTSALAIVLVIFAWTQLTQNIVTNEIGAASDLEVFMNIPVTTKPIALPPPPPKKESFLIKEVEEEPETIEEKKEEEIIVPLSDLSTVGKPISTPANFGSLKGMELEKEPEETFVEVIEDNTVITVPDQMPRFPGCEETEGDNAAKKQCADNSLMAYIYENIQYPAQAKETEIEGMAVVSFVVRKDGRIADVQILRDPGGGCGKEAARVIKSMKNLDKWTPGKHRGKDRHVRYNMPVRFKLK